MSPTLESFMKREQMSDADLAARIGKDRTLVNRLRRGLVKPTLEVASQIEAITDGEISMQSWVDASPNCPEPQADAA